MAKPWDELHTKIDSEEAYNEATAFKGMTVIEVYAGWCGPSLAMVPTLKKLQWDMVEEKGAALQFVVAKSDNIPTLKEFAERSKPVFMVFRKGNKLLTVDGCNTNVLRSFVEENAPSVAEINAEGG